MIDPTDQMGGLQDWVLVSVKNVSMLEMHIDCSVYIEVLYLMYDFSLSLSLSLSLSW